MNVLGNRIKRERENLNLSREDLAKRLGVSYSAIAMYEQGNREPNNDLTVKMCEIFDCSMDYLMGKSEIKKVQVSSSFEEIKKHYEEQYNTLLKNKYINEFLKLNLSNFEIESLLKVLDFEEGLSSQDYATLLNSTLSILAINHGKTIVDNVKQLIFKYSQEKLTILYKELEILQENEKKQKESIKNEHIDELHSVISGKKNASLDEKIESVLEYMNKNGLNECYMCPVYGRISAGQPNWAEECIEGRIPIDPTMMNISNAEQCFFLKVNGESMNKLVKNGGYALIRKQDTVENGEIAVVLVNGDEATLKKFKQLDNGFIFLEPQSNLDEFEPLVINPKETSIKILGKYIGKFEINR